MCPTFSATGDEIMCTRGRANTIRAVLDGRIPTHDPLVCEALEAALSNCLSCKACKKECPSNVDLALLKAELLYARQRKHGVRLLERMVSRFDLLGKMGCLSPSLANAILQTNASRLLIEKVVGLASKRPLPRYANERFDYWFAKRIANGTKTRGPVILWDDCSVRYYEPHIGIAAVRVLEVAGYEVVLPENASCCGRPAFSVGRLDVAKRFGEHNVALLRSGETPIVFLEPSCYSMFRGDYRELKIPGAEDVAARCFLFETFIDELLQREPGAIAFRDEACDVAIHAHCHAKALTDVMVMPRLANRLPKRRAQLMDTGCCGMAGSFGALRTKYDLSLQVAAPLIQRVNALKPGTRIVASGTSCRQQLTHLSHVRPVHIAELLADAISG